MEQKLALVQCQPRPDLALPKADPTLNVIELLHQALRSLTPQCQEARQYIVNAISSLEVIESIADIPRSPLPASRGKLLPWQILRVTRHIEASQTGLIRVQELAALTHLSVSYFTRAFRITMGMTPYSFVIKQRVARAKTMMLLEDAALSQIALASGFADQAHLTRLFHRVTGQSPSAWRRANKTVNYDFGHSVANPASSFNRVFHG